jgi:hypothetical protein
MDIVALQFEVTRAIAGCLIGLALLLCFLVVSTGR